MWPFVAIRIVHRLYVAVLCFDPFVPNACFVYSLKTGGRERVNWERMG